jgi:hypothetical protein
MPEQSAALKRCASCDRWSGPREALAPDAVRIADVQDTGTCCGGPWDGQLRRARSACGRWTRWLTLDAGDQRTA